MFSRHYFSLFLAGLALGSPWLVRDWLNSGSRNSGSGDRPASLSAGPTGADPAKGKHAPRKAVAASAHRDESAERTPYPLASKTRRLVEGFFGSDGLIGLHPGGGPPATPRSRAIVTEATRRLAPALSKLDLECGDPLVLRLFKEEGEVEIWMQAETGAHYTLFKVLRLSSSSGSPGPKIREGDGQAPEGFYAITRRGLRPETRHYLGLDFGYPNELDRALGRTGSEMMIHAGATSAGSYALAPEAMEEVYALVDAALRAGETAVPVHLFPSRLTDGRMNEIVEERSRWTEEWVRLKEGYDFFENVRLPPLVTVESGHYRFRLGGSEN